VAGMEMATVAATRGHNVTLYEKDSKLGGQTKMASTFPQLEMEDLDVAVDWLSQQINKLKVKVELNKTATAQTIKEQNPDVVVVATGSTASLPDIPGANRKNVGTLDDYLRGKLSAGKRVALIGGGYGAECAISLAREGKEVTLMEDGPKEKIGVTPYTPLFGARYLYCMQSMGKSGVKTLVQVKVKEITDKGVKYFDDKGNENLLEVDTVIFSLVRVPNVELANELKGKVSELYTLGDAVKPGVIHDAIHPAFALGSKI